MHPWMSESIGGSPDARMQGLWLLLMLLVLAIALMAALLLARWAARRAQAGLKSTDARRSRHDPPTIDPWQEAGRRAEPLPEQQGDTPPDHGDHGPDRGQNQDRPDEPPR